MLLPICPRAHSEPRLFNIGQSGFLTSFMKSSMYLEFFNNSTPLVVFTNSPNKWGGIFYMLLLFVFNLNVNLISDNLI